MIKISPQDAQHSLADLAVIVQRHARESSELPHGEFAILLSYTRVPMITLLQTLGHGDLAQELRDHPFLPTTPGRKPTRDLMSKIYCEATNTPYRSQT